MDDVYIMTTTGGAHAYQIEQQSSDTLDSITQLIQYPNPQKNTSYANAQ